MKREQIVEYLRENPVFWSRLGFCYDPPICDENGEIIETVINLQEIVVAINVFTKNFN